MVKRCASNNRRVLELQSIKVKMLAAWQIERQSYLLQRSGKEWKKSFDGLLDLFREVLPMVELSDTNLYGNVLSELLWRSLTRSIGTDDHNMAFCAVERWILLGLAIYPPRMVVPLIRRGCRSTFSSQLGHALYFLDTSQDWRRLQGFMNLRKPIAVARKCNIIRKHILHEWIATLLAVYG